MMLGHCGKPEDAKALRALLDDPDRVFSSGLDGVLAGYILLDHKAGWEYLVKLIKNAGPGIPGPLRGPQDGALLLGDPGRT